MDTIQGRRANPTQPNPACDRPLVFHSNVKTHVFNYMGRAKLRKKAFFFLQEAGGGTLSGLDSEELAGGGGGKRDGDGGAPAYGGTPSPLH
ncbi:unnamed protein product [Ilex paraguariensis]|uniref:Uncharacterized protein n=1 Tax=Ilex paraguariensis TaxID=185542 RepID=A0ABC8SAC7_9AQUA